MPRRTAWHVQDPHRARKDGSEGRWERLPGALLGSTWTGVAALGPKLGGSCENDSAALPTTSDRKGREDL